jgi:carbonic anhydrase/acetyltransferase-like protein (isoleucine patch superfamily)
VTTKILRRLRAILIELVDAKLRFVGYIPFHHVRRFFYRIFGISIGSGSTIHMFATFYNPFNITIGKDSIIGEWAVLDGRAPLIIGSHVDIASGVMVYNAEHDIHSKNFTTAHMDKVVIEDYVFIGNQRAYPEAYKLPEYIDEEADTMGEMDASEKDSFFEEAARIVVTHQQGSASLLQRKLKLGYNRAGRIIDQLEAAKIIGPFKGSKAREVLIKDPASLEQLLSRAFTGGLDLPSEDNPPL